MFELETTHCSKELHTDVMGQSFEDKILDLLTQFLNHGSVEV